MISAFIWHCIEKTLKVLFYYFITLVGLFHYSFTTLIVLWHFFWSTLTFLLYYCGALHTNYCSLLKLSLPYFCTTLAPILIIFCTILTLLCHYFDATLVLFVHHFGTYLFNSFLFHIKKFRAQDLQKKTRKLQYFLIAEITHFTLMSSFSSSFQHSIHDIPLTAIIFIMSCIFGFDQPYTILKCTD